MASHDTNHKFFACGWWFWCQVSRKRTLGPSDSLFTETLRFCLQKIGKAHYTEESPWNGIIPSVGSIYRCQDTPRKPDRGTNMMTPRNHNTAPIVHRPKYTALLHTNPCQRMIHQQWTMNGKYESNKSLVVSSITEGQWISLYCPHL